MSTTAFQEPTPPFLEPVLNVGKEGKLFRALSAEPWLRLRLALPPRGGQWVRMEYQSSFLDPLVRPILRFISANGHADAYLPGALWGRGIWIGYVPAGTRDVHICPVASPGLFGFQVEKVEKLSTGQILHRAFRRSRGKTFAAISARVRRMPVEAQEELAYAICHRPISEYDSWRRKRLRAFDPKGLDSPRADWSQTPHIRIAVSMTQAPAGALEKLLEALQSQPYPKWSVAALGDPSAKQSPEIMNALGAGRLIRLAPVATARDLTFGMAAGDLLGRCAITDKIPESALVIVAEHAVANPDQSLLYGDEDRVNDDGRHVDPRLKPDWSPVFQANANYIGAAVFARASLLNGLNGPIALFADPATNVSDLFALDDMGIGHVRRILLSRHDKAAVLASPSRNVMSADQKPSDARPAATIIIPTRDRLDLLRACVSSLIAKTGSTPFEAIIVDNGSVEKRTLDYLAALEGDNRFRILRRPGPFNFSALCNDAAAIASGDILVFLNNDTEVVSACWLDPLIRLASLKESGAVGAKLLYPSGKIQHVGVVVGLGGRAGHIGAGQAGDDKGYLDGFSVTREVMAVTGACLAVAREKFQSIQGFNAAELPVDLNDIDLCLRLREAGFSNLVSSECVLIHRESASRTRLAQPSLKYAREWAYFTTRWGREIRDDPTFHPALSHYSLKTALA